MAEYYKQLPRVVTDYIPELPEEKQEVKPDLSPIGDILTGLKRIGNIMSVPLGYATSQVYTGNTDAAKESEGTKNFLDQLRSIENPFNEDNLMAGVRKLGEANEKIKKSLDVPLPMSEEYLKKLEKDKNTYNQYKTGGLSFLGLGLADAYKNTDSELGKKAIASGSDLAFDPLNIAESELLGPLALGQTRTVKEMIKKFGPIEGEIIAKEIERQAANNTKKDLLQRLGNPQEVRSDKLFNQEELKELAKPGYKSREKLINMPIEDFQKLHEKLDNPSPYNINRIKDAIDNGIPLSDIPFLDFDIPDESKKLAEVIGHEGRHRARVLKEQGYTNMPVLLSSRSTPRWSEQAEQFTKRGYKNMDYLEHWPTKIKGEDSYFGGKHSVNNNVLDFPVTREQASRKMMPIEYQRPELMENETLQKILKDAPSSKINIYTNPHDENMYFLNLLKEQIQNEKNGVKPFNEGVFNKVYETSDPEVVVKAPGSMLENSPRKYSTTDDAESLIKDQIMFNTLDKMGLAPKTKTIATKDRIYALQQKLNTPTEITPELTEDISNLVSDIYDKTGGNINIIDRKFKNFGTDKEGKILPLDLNVMLRDPKISQKDLEELLGNLLVSQNNKTVDEVLARILDKNPETKAAIESSKTPNILNRPRLSPEIEKITKVEPSLADQVKALEEEYLNKNYNPELNLMKLLNVKKGK